MKFLILLTMTATAFANINTTTTSNQSQSFLKKIAPTRIGYFSIFSGPSLGSGDRIKADGSVDEGSINTWNQVSFGWKINDKARFVINPRFEINHNSPSADKVSALDPVFGVALTYFKNDNLTIGGGLNTILPFARTESTEEKGRLFNPGGFQFLDYKLTSKVSVGTWLWARMYFYDGTVQRDDDGNIKGNRLAFFTAPLITYSFSDKFSATAYYQFDGEQSKSNPLAMKKEDHLGLITSFTVNKLLTLQPMLTFYASNGLDMAKANFNMWLSGRFF